MTIADPGEYVMLQAPYFGVFDKDISVDTGVNILSFRNPDVEDLSVNIETLEAAYYQAIEEGKKVTAVVVANPHNPSGM
jgi:aspartate/methionine/tyrosine aminotransferase